MSAKEFKVTAPLAGMSIKFKFREVDVRAAAASLRRLESDADSDALYEALSPLMGNVTASVEIGPGSIPVALPGLPQGVPPISTDQLRKMVQGR